MSSQWTPPPSFTPGGLLRAVNLNIFRDNLRFLYDKPRVAVRLTAAQSVNSQADTTVSWGQRPWGWPGMWNPQSPASVLIERPGIYAFGLSMLWNDNARSGGIKRAAFLHVNGSRRAGWCQIPPSSPSEYSGVIYTNVAAGDVVTVQVRQDSGAPLSLQPTRTRLTVVWDAAPPHSGGE